MPLEEILTSEEYYDLFKSLLNCIELYPDLLGNRKDLFGRLRNLYVNSADDVESEFIITVRDKQK